MSDILADLNAAQGEAVTAPDGPVLVVAGAGSGKTRVLTTRIAWLLQQKAIPPGELLAFTFTNRAAREMRERVASLVGEGRAPHWIGTFHATGLRILRRDGERIGISPHFTIYDSDDSLRLVKQVLGELEIDPKQTTPRAVRSCISSWKNEDCTPETARAAARTGVDEKLATAYAAYEKALHRSDALDFDDLILKTVHLLEQVTEVRARYAGRFRHVLVDEFQDTNPLQLVLIKALSSEHGNLFVVGDDDQAIYSWRGARIENMLEFEDYFPGTTLLRLEQNYRSTGHILAAANAVIAHNRRRKGKNLWTAGSRGSLLSSDETGDGEDEAALLVDAVREEMAAGASRSDVTVLYRTNAQSRLLEDALRRASVPYQVVGSVQFYERREVRDLLAYLKLVANPRDQVSALRVINVPRRGIGATTCSRLVELANARGLSLGETVSEPGLLAEVLGGAACRRLRAFYGQVAAWRAAAQDLSAPKLLERILADIDYAGFLQKNDPDTAGARNENIAELLNAAYSFADASGGGRLPQFLEQVALVSDADSIRDGEGAVRLMTIHTAKGLEFPVVILTGCEENLLPHIAGSDTENGLEEERRLFYVALTRARRRVRLLYARRRRRFGIYEDCHPSRFLAEIPAELIERRTMAAAFDVPAAGRGPAAGRPSLWSPQVAPSTRAKVRRPARTGNLASWQSVARSQAGADSWDEDVTQSETPYYPGQTVMHASYGSGVVARIEGQGEDLSVTVDFPDHGRKHLLPKYAPLRPLD